MRKVLYNSITNEIGILMYDRTMVDVGLNEREKFKWELKKLKWYRPYHRPYWRMIGYL